MNSWFRWKSTGSFKNVYQCLIDVVFQYAILDKLIDSSIVVPLNLLFYMTKISWKSSTILSNKLKVSRVYKSYNKNIKYGTFTLGFIALAIVSKILYSMIFKILVAFFMQAWQDVHSWLEYIAANEFEWLKFLRTQDEQ